MISTSSIIRSLPGFSKLGETELDAIARRVTRQDYKRGEEIVRVDEPSDTIFIVLSGRFLVYLKDNPKPVAEIATGELIGEIGFFSGSPRTATVVAARDAAAVSLSRMAFDEIAKANPQIYEVILSSLATRLAAVSQRVPPIGRSKTARTVAVVPGGDGALYQPFIERLQNVFSSRGRPLFLDQAEITRRFPGKSPDYPVVSDWLNQCEYEYELVVYFGAATADPWTQKAIRQADQVITVVSGTPPQNLNATEQLALQTHDDAHRRLVVAHPKRPMTPRGVIATGTRLWLSNRPVFQHHHVSLEDDEDFARLHRFLTGQAIGFVAAGGGGYGPAHVGIYKALTERGVSFDMLGGTSVGASLVAGFAMLRTPEQVDENTGGIFVKARAFKRRTFPRYSILDHIPFDDVLRRLTGEHDIEDAWLPYFAVATDLSASGPIVLRSGSMWKAMRASGSIPAALPPMFTDDGRMLVDGGLVDNIPLKPMHDLKDGPNVVVHFGLPRVELFKVAYDAIPGLWPLIARMLFSRGKLPKAPGPVAVLRRSLFANKTFDTSMVEPFDLVVSPPRFPGSSFLDFDRHAEVTSASYQWGLEYVDKLLAENDPTLKALLEASR
jgi:NTE family protein